MPANLRKSCSFSCRMPFVKVPATQSPQQREEAGQTRPFGCRVQRGNEQCFNLQTEIGTKLSALLSCIDLLFSLRYALVAAVAECCCRIASVTVVLSHPPSHPASRNHLLSESVTASAAKSPCYIPPSTAVGLDYFTVGTLLQARVLILFKPLCDLVRPRLKFRLAFAQLNKSRLSVVACLILSRTVANHSSM